MKQSQAGLSKGFWCHLYRSIFFLQIWLLISVFFLEVGLRLRRYVFNHFARHLHS